MVEGKQVIKEPRERHVKRPWSVENGAGGGVDNVHDLEDLTSIWSVELGVVVQMRVKK